MIEHSTDHKNHRFRYDGLLIYRPNKRDPGIFFSGYAQTPAAIRAVIDYLEGLVEGASATNKQFGAGSQSEKLPPTDRDWTKHPMHRKRRGQEVDCTLCTAPIEIGDKYYSNGTDKVHVACGVENEELRAA